MARRIHQRAYVYEDMLEDIYAEEAKTAYERLITHVFPKQLAECRLKNKDDVCVLREVIVPSRCVKSNDGKFSAYLDNGIIAQAVVKKFADEGVDCVVRGEYMVECRVPRVE